jgi:hypothetical protein
MNPTNSLATHLDLPGAHAQLLGDGEPLLLARVQVAVLCVHVMVK